MFRSASLLLVATSAVVLSIAACSNGVVPVGSSEQALQARKDGHPTGDRNSCSWEGTTAYDVATGNTSSAPAPAGPYDLGDTFKSPDGCNDCNCSADGIMCTVRACGK